MSVGGALDLRRVSVVGTSGSGKTTFAAALATRLGRPHIELDALHWEPGWRAADPRVFRDRVAVAVNAPAWICEGNYSAVRDLVWARATTVVWLDLPFMTTLSRAVGRTFRRAVTRERLFGGENRERALGFFDPEWIPWWVMRTWRRNRLRYGRLLVDGRAARPFDVVVLRSPAEVAGFLADPPAGPTR